MPHPFRWLLARRGKEPRLEEIRKAAGKLDVTRLTGAASDSLGFSSQDFMAGPGRTKLFGYYTDEGVAYALRELGVLPRIEKRGYSDLAVTLSGDPWCQNMRITGKASGDEHLVMEGRFRKATWTLPLASAEDACSEGDYTVIKIEWFLLQNPLLGFTPERPQLPGQEHPGLGIRDEVMEVFYAVARRLDIHAYVANAMLFNNAYIYSPMFFFVDPTRQAELEAIKAAGQGRTLQDLAVAVETGFLFREGAAKPYEWSGAPMIHPLSEKLQKAYEVCGYKKVTADLAAGMNFRFDWAGYDNSRELLLNKILEAPHQMLSGNGER